MQDIINSFKAHLYERTSSPLIGSFIFYWIVCNYKLVIVLLDGDLKANEKFELIKTLYPQNILTPWEGFDIHYSALLGNGFLIPLVISLLYIFVVPYPSKFIYKFAKNKQKELLEIKQIIDDDTPLSIDQSKKIKQDYRDLETKYYNELLNLSKRNNTNDTHWLDQNKSTSQKTDIIIDDYEKSILLYLAKYPKTYKLSSEINYNFQEIESKTDYYLEKLASNDYILRQYNTNENEYEYAIYQNGRKYLVENNLI